MADIRRASRRDFIRLTTLFGASAILAACAAPPAASPTAAPKATEAAKPTEAPKPTAAAAATPTTAAVAAATPTSAAKPTAAAAATPVAQPTANPASKAGTDTWLKQWKGVKLTLSSHVGPTTDAYKTIAKDFETKTGAQVIVQAEPWTDLLAKHLAEFAANTGTFDLLTWPYVWFGHYAEGKMVDTLDSWFAKKDLVDPNYGMDDFIPAVLEAYGRYPLATSPDPKALWSVPYKFDVYIAQYRKDLFQGAGYEKLPETWADLKAAAEKVKAKNSSISPIAFPLQVDDPTVSTFLPMLCSYGGAIPNPWFDANQYPKFHEKPGIDASGALKDLVAYMPKDALNMDYDAVNVQMQQGLAAYAENWNAYLPALLDKQKSKIYETVAFDLVPGGPSGRPQGLGGWQMGISSQSKNKEAAFQFLQFTTGQTMGPALALAGGSVARFSTAKDPKVVEAFPYYPLLLKALEKISMRGIDRAWLEAQRTIGTAVSQIMSGADAKKTLTDAAAKVYEQQQKAGYHPEKTGPKPS